MINFPDLSDDGEGCEGLMLDCVLFLLETRVTIQDFELVDPILLGCLSEDDNIGVLVQFLNDVLFGVDIDEVEIFFIDSRGYCLSLSKNNSSFIFLESWLLDIK